MVFVISHLIGDFLLQTDFQARYKHGGLGRDPVARRALFSHVTAYTLAFVPALIWIGGELSLVGTLAVAALIFLPHLIQDDGRLVVRWMADVKHTDAATAPRGVTVMVDQTFHLIALFLLAVLVALLT